MLSPYNTLFSEKAKILLSYLENYVSATIITRLERDREAARNNVNICLDRQVTLIIAIV